MNIMCCYTNDKLTPEALLSFGLYAPEVEMVNVTGDWSSRESMTRSQTRFWHELRDRWTGKEDLVVLDQATPITPAALAAWHCDGLLCVWHSVRRYSAELQRKIPADQIGGDYFVWHLLNERLNTLWSLHRIAPCLHA